MGPLDLIETETGLACIGDDSLTGLKDQHVVLKIGVPLWDSKFVMFGFHASTCSSKIGVNIYEP